MTGRDYTAVAELAAALVSKSRPIISQYFRQTPDISQKSDKTPVTIADKEVELALRQAITARFPDHNIIGEEQDNIDQSSSMTWVIDPIDGTRAFSCGNPMFGTLIAGTKTFQTWPRGGPRMRRTNKKHHLSSLNIEKLLIRPPFAKTCLQNYK